MLRIYIFRLIMTLCLAQLVVSQSDKVKRVAIGESVKLVCNVRANITLKETKFKWFTGQDLLSKSQILTINDVQLSDGGIYRCESQSITIEDKEINQKDSTELIVGDSADESLNFGGGEDHEGGVALLPKIQISGQNQSESTKLLETMKLALNCAVFTSAPRDSYTIQWTQPNKIKVNGSVLFIDKILKSTNEGVYKCEVKHRSGATKTASLVLFIEELPLKIKSSSNERLETGGMISRECIVNLPVTKLEEEFDYTWYKDGVVVSNKNPLILSIQNGREQSGEYKCMAIGRSTKVRVEATSNVQIVDKKGTQFQLTLTQDPPLVSIGQEVKFQAKVNPELDDAKFSWQYANGVVSQTDVYVLKSFQEGNRGLYTCNVIGLDKITKSTVRLQTAINAKVAKKVDVSLLPDDGITFTVFEGSQQELHCELPRTDNNATITWTFNRKVLDEKAMRNMSVDRNDHEYVSIISIRNVGKNHEGLYECLVGSRRLSALMKVNETKVNLSVVPKVINAIAGEPVEFHCQINSTHKQVKNSDLKWWFQVDEENVQQLDMKRWSRRDNADTSETSFISLKNAQFSDDGTYICIAPGGQKATGDLIVKRPSGKDSLEVILTPRMIRIRSHQSFQLDCLTNKDYQPYGKPQLTFKNGSSLEDFSNFNVNQDTEGRTRIEVINGFSVSQNGTIIRCEIDGKIAEATILVELDGCHPGQKICKDGSKCLEMARFCNGEVDCQDKSDEDSSYCAQCDPINKRCESVAGKSPDSPYYQAQWRCDGEDDCGNGFDEQSCPKSDTGACGSTFYGCKNEKKTIPQAFLCDLETDCNLGDDEANCTQAEIFDPSGTSQSVIVAEQGNLVTINCIAKGYPLPRIIWRANWGCLPDPGRMTVRSESQADCRTVISSLTISSFQPGDDGIYNCEALTSRSRAFSKDYILKLG